MVVIVTELLQVLLNASRTGYVPRRLVPKQLCPEVTGPKVAMSRGDWS